jgi:hypothetical protein
VTLPLGSALELIFTLAFWKKIVTPVEGTPVALKLALNQMKLLALIEVPLKFVLTELV